MSLQITGEFLESLAIASGFEILEYKGEKYVKETDSLRPLEKLVTLLLDLQSVSAAVQVSGPLGRGRGSRRAAGHGAS